MMMKITFQEFILINARVTASFFYNFLVLVVVTSGIAHSVARLNRQPSEKWPSEAQPILASGRFSSSFEDVLLYMEAQCVTLRGFW